WRRRWLRGCFAEAFLRRRRPTRRTRRRLKPIGTAVISIARTLRAPSSGSRKRRRATPSSRRPERRWQRLSSDVRSAARRRARRFDEAVRYARRALELEPRLEEARLCIARAELYQRKSGPEALEALRRSSNPYYRAIGAAMTGHTAEALAALDEAMRAHSSMM